MMFVRSDKECPGHGSGWRVGMKVTFKVCAADMIFHTDLLLDYIVNWLKEDTTFQRDKLSQSGATAAVGLKIHCTYC